MARKYFSLGARQRVQRLAPVNGGLSAVIKGAFPDVDRKATILGSVISRDFFDLPSRDFRDIRAIALAPNTDIDAVRIKFSEDSDWRYLGPGGLLFPPNGTSDGFQVEAAFPSVSTREYDASTLRNQRGREPVPPTGSFAGWQVNHTDHKIYNVSGGTLHYATWNANERFSVNHPVANGAAIPGGGMTFYLYDGAANDPVDGSNRATDITEADGDGYGFSFADAIDAGLIDTDDGSDVTGKAYVSAAAVDMHGFAGDPANPTTLLYGFQIQYGDLTPVYFGDCILEIFMSECPPPGYTPKLLPYRSYSLPDAFSVDGSSLSLGGLPTIPLIVVPAFNIERLQFTYRADNTTVVAAIAAPLWNDDTSGFEDVQEDAVTVNDSVGAALGKDWSHPWAKVVVGSTAGGTIAPGAMLTLVRREIG